MENFKGYSVYELALPAGFFIVLVNPIGLINSDFRKGFGATYELCFRYDQMCNIDSYAVLLGTALPFAIVSLLLLLIYSNGQEKMKGFLTLMAAYAIAHALHA